VSAELALIGLGSNLGAPADQLRSARRELERCGHVAAASRIYRTAPHGGPPGQPDYLNAVIALAPAPGLDEPRALLLSLLEIERSHGRSRRVRWEARTLDLDLLDFGGRVIDETGLMLPHPRLGERAFVLAPLCEAVPHWRHPVSGRSGCELLAELPPARVTPTSIAWEPR
jgi:2-amino-4-hydroxy-6-hydroxymethyldihydropteridine diphosphokinase